MILLLYLYLTQISAAATKHSTKLQNFNLKYKPGVNSAEAIHGSCNFIMLNPLQLTQFIDLQCKGWHSDVSSHFIMPPELIMMESGEVGYKFLCKWSVILTSPLQVCIVLMTCQLSDSSKYITHNHTNETTSNLICHANSCGSHTSTTSTPVSNFDVGSF